MMVSDHSCAGDPEPRDEGGGVRGGARGQVHHGNSNHTNDNDNNDNDNNNNSNSDSNSNSNNSSNSNSNRSSPRPTTATRWATRLLTQTHT